MTVSVGGTGDAAIGRIVAGTAGGRVTITSAGGAITDNRTGEGAGNENVVASNLALSASTGIGTADDLDTSVANLEATTTTGGIFITETNSVTVGGVNTTLAGLDVTGASGAISLVAAGSITVNEGVSGPGDITLTATGATSDLTISLNSGVSSTGGNIALNADRTVTISENVSTTGAGTLTVAGSGAGARNILVNRAAVVSVVDGNLTLDADQGAAIAGNFIGLRVTGAGTRIETTGTGDISLTGRGGTDASTSNHYGIQIDTGAVVRSTSSAAGAGDINLTGTGGHGISQNSGVRIESANSLVTTVVGDVQITGTGASTATGTVNLGVLLFNGGQVTSTGTGATAGDITITGTSGSGSGDSHGVVLQNANSRVTAVDGDIQITGTATGTAGAFNTGVLLLSGGQVTSTGTGTGASAGNITITGTGGTGTHENYGVQLSGANSVVTTIDGDVQITGTARSTTTGDLNAGVKLFGGGQVTSTGTGASAGNISITGTGGAGVNQEDGVIVEGSTSRVSTVDGDVTIMGTAGSTATGQFNVGVFVLSGGQIVSSGTGADAGNITITGTGGRGTTDNYGVAISGTNSRVTAVDGDIQITGTGRSSTTGSGNIGVFLLSGGQVTSTGTGADAGNITITGTGGGGTGGENQGVALRDSTSLVTAVNGDIQITGTAPNSSGGTLNDGVELRDGAQVTTTGTGAAAGNITITGTGGAGTESNYGVQLGSNTSDISRVQAGGDGTVTIVGTGGAGTTFFNSGVAVYANAVITSSGGNVSVTGQGGGSGGEWPATA